MSHRRPREGYGYFFFFFFFAVFVTGVLAVDLIGFLLNTLSQFFVNSGLGPERTIGPDMCLTPLMVAWLRETGA
jgi:hypothetical protein